MCGGWDRTLRTLFKMAGVGGGHAHRFRDTFAVKPLEAGMPIEDVSILLGDASIKVTENETRRSRSLLKESRNGCLDLRALSAQGIYGRWHRKRLRAMVLLLLRYSYVRICDAATLRPE